MKKLIIGLVFLFGLQSVVSAELISDVTKAGQRNISDVTKPQALSRLQSMGGLTFFKDYANKQASLNADYSVGSPTATFTATRQATNSTYVDDDGVIRTANTAVNRKNNYYDSTGFHARSGVLLEPAGTNYILQSSGFSTASWDKTSATVPPVVTADQAIAPDGTLTADEIDLSTATDARVSQVNSLNNTQNDNATTFSVWLKAKTSNGSIVLSGRKGDGTFTDSVVDITTSWARYKLSIPAVAGDSSSLVYVGNRSVGGTCFNFYAWGAQLEIASDYSSYIPTTTAAVTRAADAPSTYVDASGVVQVNATNNTPRFQGGWYDATGFHAGNKGLMVEGAITNLIPKSSTIDDATWTETNTVANNADAGSTTPFGDATSPSLTASADNGTLLLATAVTAQTYSVWLKRKTGTGAVSITANGGTGYTEVTLTTDWRRFQVTAASASQTCGIKLATNTDAVYVWGNQFEASPYMTSYVPTAGAAMSRTADVLKYAISGNRTAASESTFVKFVTWGTGQNGGRTMETETKRRLEQTYPSGHFVSYANVDDSGTSTVDYAASITANTSLVIGCTYKHSSPYVAVYKDGSIGGSDTTHDFTNPTWGTSFYVGNSADAKALDGVISSIPIFSDAKDVTAVSAVTSALNS